MVRRPSAAQGASHGEIARKLGITKDTSRLWQNRWLELSAGGLPVEARLQDSPRPGCPPTFALEQITQLYALVCAPPEQVAWSGISPRNICPGSTNSRSGLASWCVNSFAVPVSPVRLTSRPRSSPSWTTSIAPWLSPSSGTTPPSPWSHE